MANDMMIIPVSQCYWRSQPQPVLSWPSPVQLRLPRRLFWLHQDQPLRWLAPRLRQEPLVARSVLFWLLLWQLQQLQRLFWLLPGQLMLQVLALRLSLSYLMYYRPVQLYVP